MDQAEKIYGALVKSHMLLSESDDRFFEQYHLGKTRYFALLHIDQYPGISLSELSKCLLCTKGNTTRIVRGLEQEGHIARQVDPQDNRAQHLWLTEQGEKLLEDARHAYQTHKQSLFTCLEEEAANSLIENLETINRHCIAQLRPG
jgi:DNA-binding MarR family transcriptional regulator